MEFKTNEVEDKRIKDITTKKIDRKTRRTDVSFIFTPCGIGDIVEIRDNVTKKTYDVTDIDSW